MNRTTDGRLTGGGRSSAEGARERLESAKAHELVAMAHALCDERRAREAEDMARWALTQAPDLAAAQTVLARARFEQGHLREALGVLEGVVQRHPAFFVAHRWLAEVLIRLNDWPRASEILVRAEALSPGDARIGELVRQVMSASPGAPPPDPSTVPPPPVAPGLLQTGERRRTYDERPATTADLPNALVRSGSIDLMAKRTAPASFRAAPTATRLDRPPSQGPGLGQRLAAVLRQLSPAPLVRWLYLYRRFLLLGLGAIALFALTVKSVKWMLEQPSGEVAAERRVDPNGRSVAPVLAGSFMELATIRARDRRRVEQIAPEPTGRALLAEALLATEYGRPLDPDSEAWADELAEKEGGLGGPEELLAARVLDRLVRGDRASAAQLARTRGLASSDSTLLRFVEGRRLAREGNLTAALARVGDAGRSTFLPLRLLRAELLLDQGDAAAALTLVQSVLADSPAHTGALRLLMEARDALGQPLAAREREDVRSACQSAERRIPTLAAACRMHEGIALRREGKRRQALRSAMRAAHVAPDDPRLLGLIAQLLANLGADDMSTELVGRAEQFGAPEMPQLAWGRAGVRVGRDRFTPLPAGAPPGCEARLIGVRSIFVAPPTRKRPPGAIPVSDTLAKADGDLRWVADAAAARDRRAILELTRRAQSQYGDRPPSPVASYVVGTLARFTGQRPLAEAWLAQALDGHGDACRSASIYRMTLRDRGRDPERNIRLQRAIGRLGCVEKATPLAAGR